MDYITEVTNAHLNYMDQQERIFMNAPRRFYFEDASLDDVEDLLHKLSGIYFDTEQDALKAMRGIVEEAVLIMQQQKPNGEWEDA